MDGADVGILLRRRISGLPRRFRHARAALWIGGREGGEIMYAYGVLGRPHDGLLVHRIGIVIDVIREERWTHGLAVDAVAISLGLGRMARMKTVIHNLDGVDPHGRRQDVV